MKFNQEFEVWDQRIADAANAMADKAAELDLTLEEFRWATEVAKNMLIAEFEKTTRVDEIIVRAEVWDNKGGANGIVCKSSDGGV